MSELQRSSLDAQDIAQNNLQDWLKGVVNNLQEVTVSRTQEKTQLWITNRDASDVIPSCVDPKELDLSWLTKINVKSVSIELELLQRNSELERENKHLRKELLEQKLLLLEYKTTTEAKLEEARIRKKTWSEAIMLSKRKWRSSQKIQTEWSKRWWKCSKNKPNLSCAPLTCLFSLFLLLHVSAFESLLCFWTYFCGIMQSEGMVPHWVALRCLWFWCLWMPLSLSLS